MVYHLIFCFCFLFFHIHKFIHHVVPTNIVFSNNSNYFVLRSSTYIILRNQKDLCMCYHSHWPMTAYVYKLSQIWGQHILGDIRGLISHLPR
jgi:hypothetical protein